MRAVRFCLTCLPALPGLCFMLSNPGIASAQEPASAPLVEPSPVSPMAPAEIVPATLPATPPSQPLEVAPTPTQTTAASPAVDNKVDEAKKWVPTIYGFAEFDSIIDTTQSFNDLAGNQAIARPGSYAGEHDRVTFGVRNSRIGFKLAAPQLGEVKASALIEADFLGNQPAGTAESALFTSPLLRVRHAALKLESPYLDFLFGQSWALFGWQPYFHPNSVDIQGLPGQIFARSPQARVSHRFKSDAVDFELAVAALRPPQRNGAVPDLQAGARLFFNNWKGVHTTGSAGTAGDSAAIGVSGVTRHFAVPELSAAPKSSQSKQGWGFSADVMLPIVPSTAEDRSNGLVLTGSYVRGEGIAGLFTGLNGGVTTYPALPKDAMGAAQTYVPDIDAGDVMFDKSGKLQTVGWQALMAGLQYYFPGSGKVWLSANYSNLKSHNAADLTNGKTAAVFKNSQWADINLFWDAVPQVRFGVEAAWYEQTYADDQKAHNVRGQFTSLFIF
jgi:hypothetical protein